MTRLTLAVAAFAALALPAAALAKGPTEGSISGPGFSKVVKVLYDGGGGSAGDNLTQESGFFPAAFGQSPDPMLHRKPAGPLGDRLESAGRRRLDVPYPAGPLPVRARRSGHIHEAGAADLRHEHSRRLVPRS
jgi:hypothetical protein